MKFILKFFVGAITLFLLSFVTFYLFTSGDYIVEKTVADNVDLNSKEVNTYKLYFERYGDTSKPLLIILHGGPGYDSKYMKVFSELSNEYHVMFYDQLGCGFSERVKPDKITIETQIQNLKLIIEGQNNDTIFLLGHSWGAMLATAYVSKYPEKIRKLVLLEPEYLTNETKDIFFENTNFMRPKFSFASISFLTKHWFQSLHIDEPDNQAGTDYMLGKYNTNAGSAWYPLRQVFCEDDGYSIDVNRFGSVASASLVSSIFDNEGNFREDIFQGAGNFENEVLILAGECNEINAGIVQQKHKELFINAALIVIPDAGFFVHIDQPEVTLKKINNFF